MLQEIVGCQSETAVGLEVLLSHIDKNKNGKYRSIDTLDDFREGVPCAVIGGAPSLKNYLDELHKYKCIIACGSVHDYLIRNGFYPDYCVVCDQDLVVLNYLKLRSKNTKYLVASQCNPKVFEYLKDYDTYIWHAHGDKFDPASFGVGETLVGGGCTVGTRGIVIGLSLGYSNIHIYGMDSSLDNNYNHHAYKFSTEEETIGNVSEVHIGGEDSPKFKVADYMLAQIFDIKSILRVYQHRAKFEVFGEGALSYFFERAKKEALKEV